MTGAPDSRGLCALGNQCAFRGEVVVYCLLFVNCCLLIVVYCLMFVIYCLLCIVLLCDVQAAVSQQHMLFTFIH